MDETEVFIEEVGRFPERGDELRFVYARDKGVAMVEEAVEVLDRMGERFAIGVEPVVKAVDGSVDSVRDFRDLVEGVLKGID